MLEDRNAHLIVAVHNSRVVGVLYAEIQEAPGDEVTQGYRRVSVEELTVRSDYQSVGVGTLLMVEAEKWAKLNQICDLTVLVYDFNDRAVDFYKKNGYKPYSIKMNKKI